MSRAFASKLEIGPGGVVCLDGVELRGVRSWTLTRTAGDMLPLLSLEMYVSEVQTKAPDPVPGAKVVPGRAITLEETT